MKNVIRCMARSTGAEVGFASDERFDRGVASMDTSHVLPGARTVISVMLPLNGDIIRRYLSKTDHMSLQMHETEVYVRLHELCRGIAGFLRSKGHRAVALQPNLDYRFKEGKKYRRVPFVLRQRLTDWLSSRSGVFTTQVKRIMVQLLYEKTADYTDWNLTPSFSHRYAAVAAGLAGFGWSGNAMTREFGSRVLFDTVITTAEIDADPMMEETPCDGCRICTKVCQVGMIHPKIEDHVAIGGKILTHGKKGHNIRCIMCCSGLTGQDLHKGWSTWSPGRVSLPENDDRIEAFWNSFVKKHLWQHGYYSRCLSDLVFHSDYGFVDKPYDRFRTTCGNCQFVCWETREQRKENYEILTNSGEVVEGPEFSFRVKKKK